MKPYESPPIWLGLGFLTGVSFFRPGVTIAIVWAVSHFAMLTWIMRDVPRPHEPENHDG